jgi:hypothetical protein
MGDGWREIIGQYKCECGAIYKKISTSIVPFSDMEGADCEVCGKQMDSWSNSTSCFHYYELIRRPE